MKSIIIITFNYTHPKNLSHKEVGVALRNKKINIYTTDTSWMQKTRIYDYMVLKKDGSYIKSNEFFTDFKKYSKTPINTDGDILDMIKLKTINFAKLER